MDPTAVTSASVNTSFFVWVASLFTGILFQQFSVWMGTGFIGMYFHFLRKKLDKRLAGSFKDYLFGSYPGRTISAITTFVGSGMTYLMSGATDGITWPALMGLAFTTGYALDSMINKGDNPDMDDQGFTPIQNPEQAPPPNNQ